MFHTIILNLLMMNYYMVNNTKSAIVDANVFIALMLPKDSLYARANTLFTEMVERKVEFVTNNYILAESFTMILKRSKNTGAALFLKNEIFENKSNIIQVNYILDKWEDEIIQCLIEQNKYKSEFMSFADCSLIVQARKQKIKTIFTFDQTFRQFRDEFEIVGI